MKSPPSQSHSGSSPPAHVAHTFLFILLSAFSLLFVLTCLRTVNTSQECHDILLVHDAIVSALHSLAPTPTVIRTAPVHPSTTTLIDLAHLRRLSTRYLRLRASIPPRTCPPSRPPKLSLEFTLASRAPTDGVLLYLLSVLGTTRKQVLEIDNCPDKTAAGVAVLLAHVGWHVVALHERWTGFEAARIFYISHPNSNVVDAAGPIDATRAKALTRSSFIVGRIDLAIFRPGGGRELAMLRMLANPSELRPRIALVDFRRFWGMANRTRLGGNDDREFVGGSMVAVAQLVQNAGFRVVWCLRKWPGLVMVDARAGVGDGVLESIDMRECLPQDDVSRRDAEAMWDAAQRFTWEGEV